MRDANSPRLRRRVFLLCWVGYTVSYLLRTNLSAALDKLIEDMHISRAMAGGIGSLYFWMYAVGQLVNGYLAERLNPKPANKKSRPKRAGAKKNKRERGSTERNSKQAAASHRESRQPDGCW